MREMMKNRLAKRRKRRRFPVSDAEKINYNVVF
jgi:hypothetical protein